MATTDIIVTKKKRNTYPVQDLAVGERFLVKNARMWRAASQTAYRYGKKEGREFTCTTITENGTEYLEVKRVA